MCRCVKWPTLIIWLLHSDLFTTEVELNFWVYNETTTKEVRSTEGECCIHAYDCNIITHRLTLPSSPNSFWRKTKFLLSPTHRTPLIWHPVTYFQNEIEAEMTPVRYHRDPNQIAECLTLWQKRTFRKLSKNGDCGTGATCGRELLRGWRRPIGLMVRFIIFTASVQKIFDQPAYEALIQAKRRQEVIDIRQMTREKILCAVWWHLFGRNWTRSTKTRGAFVSNISR
jgi:hypothetical protein